MSDEFKKHFNKLPVLVTGHTGFKGAWLSFWLDELGADVTGFSLQEPPSEPSLFQVCGMDKHVTDIRGDIRDIAALEHVIALCKPVVIFHLAAQSLVLPGPLQSQISSFQTIFPDLFQGERIDLINRVLSG